jgi:hypothetical protein
MSMRGRGHSRSVMPGTSQMRRGHSPMRGVRAADSSSSNELSRRCRLGRQATPPPPLTKTNYNQWAMLMKIKLEACGLWSAVDPGDAEFQVDMMALDVIYSVVPSEMVTLLATKGTTMNAWESIKMVRISDECVRLVTV